MNNLKQTTEQLRQLNDKLTNSLITTVQVQAIRREHSTDRQALREATAELKTWRKEKERERDKANVQWCSPLAPGISYSCK